jgi:hypothetical protein
VANIFLHAGACPPKVRRRRMVFVFFVVKHPDLSGFVFEEGFAFLKQFR